MLPSASKFSAEDLGRIEKAVADAEARTSGEIVPVILDASDDYSWLRSSVGMKVAILSFAAIEIFGIVKWPLPWRETAIGALWATAIAILLSMVPALGRLWIGQNRLRASVDRAAKTLFVSQGVADTKDRTGVLILLSLFERRIQIQADRGIHEKLGPDFWATLCREYGSHVRSDGHVSALCTVIARVGKELEHHFPRSADDRDELSNRLRTSETGGES
jgi:putative membrane protein